MLILVEILELILVNLNLSYFLYHESMLESVLFARDRWLKPNGLMFPERATVHLEGFHHQQMKEDYNDFWKDVYGNFLLFQLEGLRK
jgi:protein arginine N-methyltransferase 1